VNARETFERLYREHAGRVKAYALRRVGSGAAARRHARLLSKYRNISF
jgi:DNA-directed RNA polymerase specialized sigma24 family protein